MLVTNSLSLLVVWGGLFGFVFVWVGLLWFGWFFFLPVFQYF